MAPHPIALPCALAFQPPSHRDATTPSPFWASHFMTQERIMFSNPTPSRFHLGTSQFERQNLNLLCLPGQSKQRAYRWIHERRQKEWMDDVDKYTGTNCNTLQRTATHYNALQYTAKNCNTLQHITLQVSQLELSTTRCKSLQRTAVPCNTLFVECGTLEQTWKQGAHIYVWLMAWVKNDSYPSSTQLGLASAGILA